VVLNIIIVRYFCLQQKYEKFVSVGNYQLTVNSEDGGETVFGEINCIGVMELLKSASLLGKPDTIGMKKIILYFSLFIVPILCLGQDKEPKFVPFDVCASFPGGESELYKYIQEKFYYPKDALERGIQGRVALRFWIRKNGKVYKPEVIRGIHPSCDSVAIDIVKSMPDWNPGSYRGEKVDVLFTLPVLFRLPYGSTKEGSIYWLPDKMPEFPGGLDKMYEFINANLRFPLQLVESEPKGRVFVRFVVSGEGKVKNAAIIKGVHKLFDKEVLRVINLMPDWIPAKNKGENVDAYFTLPVTFRPLMSKGRDNE